MGHAGGIRSAGDAGADRKPRDLSNGPTLLSAFELPWDGSGSGNERQVYAAVSSAYSGWTGAALHIDTGDGVLLTIGRAERDRAIVGNLQSPLSPASPHLVDRASRLLVQLAMLSSRLPMPASTNWRSAQIGPGSAKKSFSSVRRPQEAAAFMSSPTCSAAEAEPSMKSETMVPTRSLSCWTIILRRSTLRRSGPRQISISSPWATQIRNRFGHRFLREVRRCVRFPQSGRA